MARSRVISKIAIIEERLRMKNKRGMTLLEVIISLYIMAILVILVMLLTSYISAYVKSGKNIALATSVAQKQIELLKTYTPEVLDGVYNAACSLEEKIVYTDEIEYHEYTRFTTISPYKSGLFDVVVKINWLEKGILKEIMLETYMKRP